VSAAYLQVWLRAERNAAGKGRLYHINYNATNQVGSGSGSAYVCLPHDASAFNRYTSEELAALKVAASKVAAAPGDGSIAPSSLAREVPVQKVTCPMPAEVAESQWMPTK
jgi:hypothetical protein